MASINHYYNQINQPVVSPSIPVHPSIHPSVHSSIHEHQYRWEIFSIELLVKLGTIGQAVPSIETIESLPFPLSMIRYIQMGNRAPDSNRRVGLASSNNNNNHDSACALNH